MPELLRSCSSAARSTSVAGDSFIHAGTKPRRKPFDRRAGVEVEPARHARRIARHPDRVIACSTSIASSTPRVIGPSLSSDQQSVIAPVRGTRPKVGRSPVTPQRIAGLTMLPCVSLPMENPTRPAAVAAPGAGAGSRSALFEQPRVHRLAAEPDVVERERAQARAWRPGPRRPRPGAATTAESVDGNAVAERLGAVGRRRCRRYRAGLSRRTEYRAAARGTSPQRSPRPPACACAAPALA